MHILLYYLGKTSLLANNYSLYLYMLRHDKKGKKESDRKSTKYELYSRTKRQKQEGKCNFEGEQYFTKRKV